MKTLALLRNSQDKPEVIVDLDSIIAVLDHPEGTTVMLTGDRMFKSTILIDSMFEQLHAAALQALAKKDSQ